jgi:hypothetical protein
MPKQHTSHQNRRPSTNNLNTNMHDDKTMVNHDQRLLTVELELQVVVGEIERPHAQQAVRGACKETAADDTN